MQTFMLGNRKGYPTAEGETYEGVLYVQAIRWGQFRYNGGKDPPGSVKRYVKDKGYSRDHKY